MAQQYIHAQKEILVSGLFYRDVMVNRTQTPEEAMLSVPQRRKYLLNKEILQTIPTGACVEEVRVFFINFDCRGFMYDKAVAKKVDELGFRFVDIYPLCAINEQDPEFCDEHQNCTQWYDKDGSLVSFEIFERADGVLRIEKVRASYYGTCWWFACVRK